jgi:uncharacterized cupredoxin-like copper-binding protein
MLIQSRKALAVVVGLLLLPLLAACGGSKAVNVSAGTPSETYTMTLSQSSAAAGDVTFHVTNNAAAETHEFVVVRTDLAADSLPLNADGNVDEDQIDGVDEVEDIMPGESKDLTVNLTPGHYALICNIDEHYGQGMHIDFTVN